MAKRKTSKPKKRKREPAIVSRSKKSAVSCPRCGETESIILTHSYYGGKKSYRCFSEDCKKNGAQQGKGRPFVILPDGEWVGRGKTQGQK